MTSQSKENSMLSQPTNHTRDAKLFLPPAFPAFTAIKSDFASMEPA